jgi:hypothetical protein
MHIEAFESLLHMSRTTPRTQGRALSKIMREKLGGSPQLARIVFASFRIAQLTVETDFWAKLIETSQV